MTKMRERRRQCCNAQLRALRERTRVLAEAAIQGLKDVAADRVLNEAEVDDLLLTDVRERLRLRETAVEVDVNEL